MIASLSLQRKIAWFLAALCVIFLGALLWEWQEGKRLESDLLKLRQLPVTPVPPQKILPEFTLPNQETGFPEFLARPIFSVNRRPSGVAGKSAGGMKKGQFVLVGVLISPQRRSALLRDVVTQKTQTVPLVGQVRGLTLGDIQTDSVTLRLGAESEVLQLNVQTAPKPLQSSAVPVVPLAPPSAPGASPAVAPATPASASTPPVKPIQESPQQPQQPRRAAGLPQIPASLEALLFKRPAQSQPTPSN